MYTLTLTADSGCTELPDDARTRTYTATIVPGSRPTTFVGTLSDARIVSVPIWLPYFEIGVAGDLIRRGAEQLDLLIAQDGRHEKHDAGVQLDASVPATELDWPAPTRSVHALGKDGAWG